MTRASAHSVALSALALLLLTPASAHAEVADKVVPVFAIWSWSSTSALTGLLGWWLYRPLGLLSAVSGAYLFAGVLSELHSPDVGPAIVHELGSMYAVHAYAALCVFVALHALGIVLGRARARRAKPIDADACCR